MALYDELKEAGCTIDNHESDLYVQVDDVSRSLVRAAIGREEIGQSTVSMFRSAINGTLHYDVAFAYAPFWRKRA